MTISKSNLSCWQKLLFLTAGGINLLILLFVFSIWRTGDRALDFVSNLFQISPIESKVDTSTLIVEKIRNIQELSTAVQTIETIVPTSAERKLGDFSLATTRLLYIARGEVRAGVDLSELTNSNIIVKPNSVVINLPPAKILDSKIDIDYSRVYDYNRGFLNLGPDIAPQLQTLAQKKTLVEIVNTACQEDILEQANTQAKEAIAQLLSSTGHQQIQVKTTPAVCGITEK
ncbi:MAG: DUF4230 domain-containing protein [Hyellaceae cyanobacterium CSU_1_1]|nr:DUF4230 domain-containing protein [Pleurocapsa sp. CRU_1_2]NJR44562.1 DUF4230 domain-containing protein [Hyellaceae cyanobacterium CSU_1_1]